MSSLRRATVGGSLALAILGPVAGILMLMIGELPLWNAPPIAELPPGADARIGMGTWATLACIGALVASPFRLAAAAGLAGGRAWAWPAATIGAAAGCLDLSAGFVMVVLTVALWRREGPRAAERNSVDN